MWVWGWVELGIGSVGSFLGGGGGGGGGGDWIWGFGGGGGGGGGGLWDVGLAVGVTAMAGIALVATLVIASRSGSLKSPWSRRKRKHALTRHQWNCYFTPEGKLRDGGVKFLKKVRSGGVDPSIRAEVWPFLLGVYNLNSSEAERVSVRAQHRKEYEKLRRRCRRLLRLSVEGEKEFKESVKVSYSGSPRSDEGCDSPASAKFSYSESPKFDESRNSPASEYVSSARESISIEQGSPADSDAQQSVHDETATPKLSNVEEADKSGITNADASTGETESSDTKSLCEEGSESMLMSSPAVGNLESETKFTKVASVEGDITISSRTAEDFSTWQRIIRLDAVRANAEWIIYAPAQAAVSEDKALRSAVNVGLSDYDHLEPSRIYHAARLVAVLEAYAVYDPEIGYCQGMSDLLSPILAVIEEDHEAFWCFVGFMRKARHNFRLDEVGIRRQLNTVSKIIKSKDSHLYRHLEKLQAEDCFFVYRMVVVMFRRELTFEQTLCLWEVVWADQAAIRAGIGKPAWGRIRMRAPPTDDLLLYAIAASVLQRRKLIIQRYNSMDEIIRECNNMAGQLDVWKLLDDAHDLVVNLHDKIE